MPPSANSAATPAKPSSNMKTPEGNSLITGTSFEPNAILRGAQLTLVGAYRALQNPALFTSEHYQQAALAVLAGIAIRLLLAIPTFFLTLLLQVVTLFRTATDASPTWDTDLLAGIHYIEHHVLQLPFFLMSLMRHFSPAMDTMFMDSLAWVDKTYLAKHADENPEGLRAMYYPNLKLYEAPKVKAQSKEVERKERAKEAFGVVLYRYGKKAALSLGVYLASFLPVVGPFVLPAASFFTFNRAVGTPAAVVIFGSGIFVPKKYLVMFLQSYFASRSLMRDLLHPYFTRIHYPSKLKRAWFHDRAGVLYGFALAFYLALQIPLLGVLIYGIAEASTAYLVTKITEPPPPPSDVQDFVKRDVEWKGRKEFLNLPLEKLDKFNVSVRAGGQKEGGKDGGPWADGKIPQEAKGKTFT